MLIDQPVPSRHEKPPQARAELPATSTNDGACPTDAAKNAAPVRWSSQRRTHRLGADPSDLRTVAPERTIWTSDLVQRECHQNRLAVRAHKWLKTREMMK